LVIERTTIVSEVRLSRAYSSVIVAFPISLQVLCTGRMEIDFERLAFENLARSAGSVAKLCSSVGLEYTEDPSVYFDFVVDSLFPTIDKTREELEKMEGDQKKPFVYNAPPCVKKVSNLKVNAAVFKPSGSRMLPKLAPSVQPPVVLNDGKAASVPSDLVALSRPNFTSRNDPISVGLAYCNDTIDRFVKSAEDAYFIGSEKSDYESCSDFAADLQRSVPVPNGFTLITVDYCDSYEVGLALVVDGHSSPVRRWTIDSIASAHRDLDVPTFNKCFGAISTYDIFVPLLDLPSPGGRKVTCLFGRMSELFALSKRESSAGLVSVIADHSANPAVSNRDVRAVLRKDPSLTPDFGSIARSKPVARPKRGQQKDVGTSKTGGGDRGKHREGVAPRSIATSNAASTHIDGPPALGGQSGGCINASFKFASTDVPLSAIYDHKVLPKLLPVNQSSFGDREKALIASGCCAYDTELAKKYVTSTGRMPTECAGGGIDEHLQLYDAWKYPPSCPMNPRWDPGSAISDVMTQTAEYIAALIDWSGSYNLADIRYALPPPGGRLMNCFNRCQTCNFRSGDWNILAYPGTQDTEFFEKGKNSYPSSVYWVSSCNCGSSSSDDWAAATFDPLYPVFYSTGMGFFLTTDPSTSLWEKFGAYIGSASNTFRRSYCYGKARSHERPENLIGIDGSLSGPVWAIGYSLVGGKKQYVVGHVCGASPARMPPSGAGVGKYKVLVYVVPCVFARDADLKRWGTGVAPIEMI
jgi:hypothetical protein